MRLIHVNWKKNIPNLFFVGCETERKLTEVCGCESMPVSKNGFFNLPENPLRNISLEDVTDLHLPTYHYNHRFVKMSDTHI
jgi:hypothetical protein